MFVGMDLHKNYLQIALMNDKGKVLENSRINNHLKQVGRFFNEDMKRSNEKVRVVMESSSVLLVALSWIYRSWLAIYTDGTGGIIQENKGGARRVLVVILGEANSTYETSMIR
jgi:hypothetical protein